MNRTENQLDALRLTLRGFADETGDSEAREVALRMMRDLRQEVRQKRKRENRDAVEELLRDIVRFAGWFPISTSNYNEEDFENLLSQTVEEAEGYAKEADRLLVELALEEEGL